MLSNNFYVNFILSVRLVNTPDEIGKGPTNEVEYDGNLIYDELTYFLSGEYRINFADCHTKVMPDTVEYLPRGLEGNKYSMERLKEGQFIVVHFSTTEPLPYRKAKFSDVSKNPKIKNLFMKMFTKWDEKNFVYYHECLAIFYEIIAEISLTDSTYINSKATQKLMPAMQYIHSHYRDRNFDFQILPSLCSLGYTRFLKLFRTQNGCTPSDYMNILRVNAAKEMITLGKYSLASISDILGYDNQHYFSRVFKKVTGMSPTQYKKSVINREETIEKNYIRDAEYSYTLFDDMTKLN